MRGDIRIEFFCVSLWKAGSFSRSRRNIPLNDDNECKKRVGCMMQRANGLLSKSLEFSLSSSLSPPDLNDGSGRKKGKSAGANAIWSIGDKFIRDAAGCADLAEGKLLGESTEREIRDNNIVGRLEVEG